MRRFVSMLLTLSALGVSNAQEYENLQVLPRDVSREELTQVMLSNLRDAYDFRVGVLAGMAFALAGNGAFDDAVVLAELNADVNPSVPAARRIWLQLRLGRTVQQSGIAPALAEFDRMRASDPELLDGLGWGLYRQGQQEGALAIFRHNHQQFPDDYIPSESLADALWDQGEHDAAIQMFEAWLERHSDHAMARRRLETLKSRL